MLYLILKLTFEANSISSHLTDEETLEVENPGLTTQCDSGTHMLCAQYMATTFCSSLHMSPENMTWWHLPSRDGVYFPITRIYFGQLNASEMTLCHFQAQASKGLTCFQANM